MRRSMSAERAGTRPSGKVQKFLFASKPISRVLYPNKTGMAIIPLGPALLPGSSNLPESRLRPGLRKSGCLGRIAERAAPPLLFGLAPCGVCPATGIAACAVRSYFNPGKPGRTFSPLPCSPATGVAGTRRYIFCGAFRAGGVRSAVADIPLQPSPLASTLPCGVRTFLPLALPRPPKRTGSRSGDRPACSREIYDSRDLKRVCKSNGQTTG